MDGRSPSPPARPMTPPTRRTPPPSADPRDLFTPEQWARLDDPHDGPTVSLEDVLSYARRAAERADREAAANPGGPAAG